MFLGLDAFTWFHTIASIIAIIAGWPVVRGLLNSQRPQPWTNIFLITAFLTSATGFGFPGWGPSHITGVVALVTLAIALAGLYGFGLGGAGRWMYAIGMVLSWFFLLFVLVVQFFKKIPALGAPKEPDFSNPLFAGAQIALLLWIIWLCYRAAKNFRP
jgi:hypothetical protein